MITLRTYPRLGIVTVLTLVVALVLLLAATPAMAGVSSTDGDNSNGAPTGNSYSGNTYCRDGFGVNDSQPGDPIRYSQIFVRCYGGTSWQLDSFTSKCLTGVEVFRFYALAKGATPEMRKRTRLNGGAIVSATQSRIDNPRKCSPGQKFVSIVPNAADSGGGGLDTRIVAKTPIGYSYETPLAYHLPGNNNLLTTGPISRQLTTTNCAALLPGGVPAGSAIAGLNEVTTRPTIGAKAVAVLNSIRTKFYHDMLAISPGNKAAATGYANAMMDAKSGGATSITANGLGYVQPCTSGMQANNTDAVMAARGEVFYGQCIIRRYAWSSVYRRTEGPASYAGRLPNDELVNTPLAPAGATWYGVPTTQLKEFLQDAPGATKGALSGWRDFLFRNAKISLPYGTATGQNVKRYLAENAQCAEYPGLNMQVSYEGPGSHTEDPATLQIKPAIGFVGGKLAPSTQIVVTGSVPQRGVTWSFDTTLVPPAGYTECVGANRIGCDYRIIDRTATGTGQTLTVEFYRATGPGQAFTVKVSNASYTSTVTNGEAYRLTYPSGTSLESNTGTWQTVQLGANPTTRQVTTPVADNRVGNQNAQVPVYGSVIDPG